MRSAGILLSFSLLVSHLAVGGCALMPANGPSSWDVWAGQHDPKNIPYAFVRITPKVATVLAKAAPRLVTDFPDRSRPRDIRFGIGDILSVTIFEASSGGLFIPAEGSVRPGNFITIPAQAVDVNGNISIPYAGTIRAQRSYPGRSPTSHCRWSQGSRYRTAGRCIGCGAENIADHRGRGCVKVSAYPCETDARAHSGRHYQGGRAFRTRA